MSNGCCAALGERLLRCACAISLQVGLGTLQESASGFQTREPSFDLGDDAVLFGSGWDCDHDSPQVLPQQAGHCG
jgi:hypothetical protein